jgi:hypothetical protein
MQQFLKKFLGHFVPSEDNAYRPHLLRKPWLLFFLTVILSTEGLYIAASVAHESAYNFLSAVSIGDVISLTNVERVKVGDGTLRENSLLDAAAQAKANDMATLGYFAHVGPGGKQPWSWISEAGYAYAQAGENLAVRFDESSDVVNAWMASPTHRANIVKVGYTEIGIGVAQGMYDGSPATFVVQYFGTPQNAKAAAVTPVLTPIISEAEPSQVAGAQTEQTSVISLPIATTVPSESASAASRLEESKGAETTLRQSVQAVIRASEASQNSSAWLLGGITTLILLVVVLTIIVHIEIQPTELVLGGAFVGAVAVSLLVLNANMGALKNNSQTASVNNSIERSIIVGEAASIGG